MKSSFAIVAIMALGLSLAACSGSSKSAMSSDPSKISAVLQNNFSIHNKDRDNDYDHNDDDGGILYYGHAAGAADRRASVALVKRYFAAAAAEDGAAGCALLVPFIAESVPEEDPTLPGRTCPVVLSELFKLNHRLLAEKNATLKVIAVRIEGDKGLVVFYFPAIFPVIPEVRQLTERRVGGAWKLLYLLDGIVE